MTIAFLNNLFQGPDLIILLVIVLIIFGPKKLPELARGIGQAVKEFHKAKDEFHQELTKPVPPVTVQQPPNQQPFTPAAPPAENQTAAANPAGTEPKLPI